MIVYASKTGNIKNVISKLTNNLDITDVLEIKTGNEEINKSCILFTYTTGFGEIPLEVTKFIINNKNNIYGVIGSGNKNWGLNYCKACDLIYEIFGIKTLFKFELSGNRYDIEKISSILIENKGVLNV